MLELTISLPIFIGCFFGVYDSARMTLAYSTARNAVYHGARRGIALNRPISSTAFEAAFLNNDPATITGAVAAQLDSFPFKSGAGESGWYGDGACHGPNPIYRVEALAMAYAYRIIELSTGAMRWPCLDEPGCVACVPMRTDDLGYRQLFCEGKDAASTAACVNNGVPSYAVQYLGLKCTYNVPVTATSLFLGWLPEFIPVSATTYVSMSNFANVFDANTPSSNFDTSGSCGG